MLLRDGEWLALDFILLLSHLENNKITLTRIKLFPAKLIASQNKVQEYL